MHLNETRDAGLQCLMTRKSFPHVSSVLMQIIGASGFYSRKPRDFEQYPSTGQCGRQNGPPKRSTPSSQESVNVLHHLANRII